MQKASWFYGTSEQSSTHSFHLHSCSILLILCIYIIWLAKIQSIALHPVPAHETPETQQRVSEYTDTHYQQYWNTAFQDHQVFHMFYWRSRTIDILSGN